MSPNRLDHTGSNRILGLINELTDVFENALDEENGLLIDADQVRNSMILATRCKADVTVSQVISQLPHCLQLKSAMSLRINHHGHTVQLADITNSLGIEVSGNGKFLCGEAYRVLFKNRVC